jgi:anti-sigma B factor antagonist
MVQNVFFSSDSRGEHTQILTLDGRCDESTAAEAEKRILAALEAGRTDIVVDLRGVISLNSSMLTMLSRGAIQAKAHHGQLAVVRPNPHVWSLFEERGLGRVFPSFLGLRDAFPKAVL